MDNDNSMTKSISEETRRCIRDEVKRGMPKTDAAGKFGVSVATVIRLTGDMPRKGVTSEAVSCMRKMAKAGTSVLEIAAKFGVSATTVQKYTMGVERGTRGDRSIRGRTLNLLRTLTKDGYFIPRTSHATGFLGSYRTLRMKGFPVRLAKTGNGGRRGGVTGCKTVYFMEGRGTDALRAFLSTAGKRVIGGHQMGFLMSAFGVKMSRRERERLLGSSPLETNVVSKKTERRIPAFQGVQSQLTDFFGRFLLC